MATPGENDSSRRVMPGMRSPMSPRSLVPRPRLHLIRLVSAKLRFEKILAHLGLQARAPPRAPARGQALQTA